MFHNISKIIQFYSQGFKSMTVGKTLWKVIIIKLAVMFLVLKIFFFQGYLDNKFDNDVQKSDYVIDQITNITN